MSVNDCGSLQCETSVVFQPRDGRRKSYTQGEKLLKKIPVDRHPQLSA